MSNYTFKKELIVVAPRMNGCKGKHKIEKLPSFNKDTLVARRWKKFIQPRALVVELTYEQIDYSIEAAEEDIIFNQPGVVIRDILVETGETFSEFKLSLDEAKKLIAVLQEALDESSCE